MSIQREPRRGRLVSIDWLDITSKSLDVWELLSRCERHLGTHYGELSLDIRCDDDKRFAGRGPLNLYVHADHRGSINRAGNREPWAGLQLPGSVCQAVGAEAVLALVRDVRASGGMNVSRLDIALDDFDKRFSPRSFANDFVDGRLDDELAQLSSAVVTRVKGENWNWSRKKGGCLWVGGDKSDRRLRVYDKDKESGGVVPSTRVELQMRDRYALDAVDRILDGPGSERLGRVFFDCLVSFVDLRDPQGSRTKSNQWPRRKWWEEFVGEAVPVRSSAKDDSGVWEWLRSMQRQVAGFLLVLLRAADVTDGDLMRGAHESKFVAKLVGVIFAAMGGQGVQLSATHRVRLDQLRDERRLDRGGDQTPK
mgnify:CR=1 FL=1